MVRRACGFIVFRRNQGVIEYLLLQSSNRRHRWSPPKGHVKRNETEMETALRETEEETGLLVTDFKIYEDSKQKINYRWKGTLKYVTFWLAELINYDKNVTLSDEHQEFKWLQLEEACRISLKAVQELLRNYNAYIPISPT